MISRTAALITVLNSNLGLSASPPPVPSDAPDPYVTVHEISGVELELLAGLSGRVSSVMQVNVWSHDYELAAVLRETIKAFLFGFSGGINSPPDITLSTVNHRGDRELFDGSTERYQLISRFWVWWET